MADGQNKGTRRFVVDKARHIIDKLNSANSGKDYCFVGDPQDERCVRDRVLMARLGKLSSKLIFTKQQIGFNDDVDSIRSAILTIVKESHLSALDPSVSVQQRFHGKLKRKKVGVRDLSSISLFVDDVERLLRDLYGDLGAHAFDELLRAITSVVIEFTMYVRPDLQDEYNHADDFDDMAGIRFPEGYALSSSGYRRASAAAEALVNRARQVRVNPDGFSRYTRQFVKTFCKRWPKLNGRNRTSYYDDI